MRSVMRWTFFVRAAIYLCITAFALSQPGMRAHIGSMASLVADKATSLVSRDSSADGTYPVQVAPSAVGTEAVVAEKLELLNSLPVTAPTYSGYDRDQWGPWSDVDGDCLNTRHELLSVTSEVPVEVSSRGCWVLAGRWWDPYSNQWFTDPADIDIDHVVAVAEAHRSGGSNWSRERKVEFYNDATMGNLVPVWDVANRDKSASDPAQWLPANESVHCAFATQWVNVKAAWDLSVDVDEYKALADILAGCTDEDLDAVKPKNL